MAGIEAFERDGKNYIFFDAEDLRDNEDMRDYIEDAKVLIQGYPEKSVLSLCNVMTFFDTGTKTLVAEWLAFNKPYVIACAVFASDGLRRIMMGDMARRAGRNKFKYFPSKTEAMEWLAAFDD